MRLFPPGSAYLPTPLSMLPHGLRPLNMFSSSFLIAHLGLLSCCRLINLLTTGEMRSISIMIIQWSERASSSRATLQLITFLETAGVAQVRSITNSPQRLTHVLVDPVLSRTSPTWAAHFSTALPLASVRVAPHITDLALK